MKKDINSIYSTCVGCPATCKNWYQPIVCPKICETGCKCKNGYYLTDCGKCVPLWKCFAGSLASSQAPLPSTVTTALPISTSIVPKVTILSATPQKLGKNITISIQAQVNLDRAHKKQKRNQHIHKIKSESNKEKHSRKKRHYKHHRHHNKHQYHDKN